LLDIEKRAMLPDALPRGYLHGFAFAPDSRSFYYVHEPLNPRSSQRHVVSTHVLGTRFADDEEIYCAGNGKHLRLHIISGTTHLGFFVVRFQDTTRTDFYLWPINGAGAPEPLIQNASYAFGPRFLKDGRILALTDLGAPNRRIVEIRHLEESTPEFVDIVKTDDAPIQNWTVCGN
jgi:hypothetical protein